MPTTEEQLVIDQFTRVAKGLNWQTITIDTSGPTIRLTLEHDKPPPLRELSQPAPR